MRNVARISVVHRILIWMLYLALVVSACLTQLFGLIYVLPLCLFGLIQLRFSVHLTRENVVAFATSTLTTLKTNPGDIIAGIFAKQPASPGENAPAGNSFDSTVPQVPMYFSTPPDPRTQQYRPC